MELSKAQVIAEEVKTKLKPFCERIEIAGSIRRKRPEVHDIDLVCQPSSMGQFYYALMQLGHVAMGGKKVGDNKLFRVILPGNVSLDVYIATPETWATLLLIRTGSREHNIKLCSLAKNNGMKLHADGSGLFRFTDCEGTESRIAGDTEESIFAALGLPYKRPEERN